MSGLWTSYNPVSIYFGRGCREYLVDELTNQRCLLVASARGRRQMCSDSILGSLVNRPQNQWVDTVRSNPDMNDLQRDVDGLGGQTFDAIIGFGGGSALDTAKVLSVSLAPEINGTALLSDLLKKPIRHEDVTPLPLYSVPSTAGTGSEVTPFATIWDHELRKKHSLSGPAVFPHTAVVDPLLTNELPYEETLFSGIDSINQAAESIWNTNATPITIGYATRALRLGFKALPKLVKGEGGVAERTQMAECSLLAGLSISQTRTALCHSISYPITAYFGVPHGLACAFTMPAVLRLNLKSDDARFQQLEKDLGYSDLQQAFDVLNGQLRVTELLKKYVRSLDELQAHIDEMLTPGRADNNLVQVNTHIINQLLIDAWQQA